VFATYEEEHLTPPARGHHHLPGWPSLRVGEFPEVLLEKLRAATDPRLFPPSRRWAPRGVFLWDVSIGTASFTLQYSVSRILGRVATVQPDPAREVDILPDVLDRVATIEVTREWKGPQKRTYTVVSALSSASCGYPFKVGEYLLLVFDDEPPRLDGCCGKGSVSDMRLLIRAFDKASRRKPLTVPADLN
jgi:hypothetical protein